MLALFMTVVTLYSFVGLYIDVLYIYLQSLAFLVNQQGLDTILMDMP